MPFTSVFRGLFALVACAIATAANAAWPGIAWEVQPAPVAGKTRFTMPYGFDIVAVAPGGDVFVAATDATASSSSGCMFVARYARNDGSLVWRRDQCDLEGDVFALAVDASGDVVLGGRVWSASQTNARVLKYAGANGALLWERIYDLGSATQAERANSIAVDAQGDIYAAMSSTGGPSRVVRFSRDGALVWESELVPRVWRVMAGPQGAVFATGSETTDAASAAVVVRLDASTGAVRWRERFGDGGARAVDLVVDAAGDAIAAGHVPGAGFFDMRIAKFAGSTGRMLWRHDLATAGDDKASALAVDARNDIAATGREGAAHVTLKLRGADGARVWRSAFSAAGEDRSALGVDVAFDPSGNVIVVGADNISSATFPDTQMRVIAYAAESGAELWSIPRKVFTVDTTPSSVAVGPDGVYVAGFGFDSGKIIVGKYTLAAVPAINVQALWWASPPGSESGWGLNLVHQGDLVFATLFTYDLQRRPTWYVMSEGRRNGVNRYFGALYQVSAYTFDGSPFNPTLVDAREAGAAVLEFSDESNGTFRYQLFGEQRTKAITRQAFASPVPTCGFADAPALGNYQDLWWRAPAGSEPGWGLNIAQQGDVLFATWFTYAAGGAPTWLVASEMRRGSDGRYVGDLYRTTGPWVMTQPWNPGTVTVARAGSATLAFSSANDGVFGYTVDGVSGSKPITRQVFSAPQTACR